MLVARIAGATRVLHKPADWDDKAGKCGSLSIKDEEINGAPFMASAWQPTPEEIERLKKGACVLLYVCGRTHPPVALHVGAEPE